MKLHLVLLFGCLYFAACTHQTLVLAPGDKPGEHTGTVLKLSEYLPPGKGQVKVILLHGVGDHCPGYGLDPKDGWLSEKNTKVLGLTKKGNQLAIVTHILDSTFTEKPRGPYQDRQSRVSIVRQNFIYQASGTSESTDVEILEITWSELTQWLKTLQVGYDLTRPLKERPNELNCLPQIQLPMVARPPSRVLANRVIKELVLDRNLLDAVIYAGSYGINIQRGFAEALCTAISPVISTGDNMPTCDWSKIPNDSDTRYIFITHSLGSRIAIDTLLGLYDVTVRPGLQKPIFSEKEVKISKPFIENMLNKTSVIYMMANQLSILGLANTPLTLSSIDDPVFMKGRIDHGLDTQELLAGGPLLRDSKDKTVTVVAHGKQILDAEEGKTIGTCAINPLIKLATVKSKSHATLSGNNKWRNSLDIVAFHDTNDLLTWAVPPWYENKQLNCAPNLTVVNAFVQTAQPWFIFADPLKAHSEYFNKREVWDLMRCGAERGVVTSC